MTFDQQKYLQKFIAEKYETLWKAEWELECLETIHKEYLIRETETKFRTQLAELREKSGDMEELERLSWEIEQCKDARRLQINWKSSIETLKKQIEILEGKI